MPLHSLVALVDTPVDYTVFAGSITTMLGGLVAGLALVIVGALSIKGVTWGVPKLVRFFTRLS